MFAFEISSVLLRFVLLVPYLIVYPVIAEPPFSGAVQPTVIFFAPPATEGFDIFAGAVFVSLSISSNILS